MPFFYEFSVRPTIEFRKVSDGTAANRARIEQPGGYHLESQSETKPNAKRNLDDSSLKEPRKRARETSATVSEQNTKDASHQLNPSSPPPEPRSFLDLFLGLAGELRNKIYGELCMDSGFVFRYDNVTFHAQRGASNADRAPINVRVESDRITLERWHRYGYEGFLASSEQVRREAISEFQHLGSFYMIYTNAHIIPFFYRPSVHHEIPEVGNELDIGQVSGLELVLYGYRRRLMAPGESGSWSNGDMFDPYSVVELEHSSQDDIKHLAEAFLAHANPPSLENFYCTFVFDGTPGGATAKPCRLLTDYFQHLTPLLKTTKVFTQVSAILEDGSPMAKQAGPVTAALFAMAEAVFGRVSWLNGFTLFQRLPYGGFQVLSKGWLPRVEESRGPWTILSVG